MAAIVQGPIIPSRLYRYRSLARNKLAIKQEIQSITGNFVYCPTFTRMNDPMEGFFRSSGLLQKHPNYDTILNDITDLKSNLGMACFSETYESSLMWSHYAGNYSGICISYSSQDLIDGLPRGTSLVRLAYVDQPPLIDTKLIRDRQTAAIRVLSHKQYPWSYEREWRLLADVGAIHYGAKQAIRSIFLGSRISQKYRETIIESVRGSNIRVYEMDVGEDGYEIFWNEVDVPAKPKRKTRSSKSKSRPSKRKTRK